MAEEKFQIIFDELKIEVDKFNTDSEQNIESLNEENEIVSLFSEFQESFVEPTFSVIDRV